MEGRTSGEGKGWRGEQMARERDEVEYTWKGKGAVKTRENFIPYFNRHSFPG